MKNVSNEKLTTNYCTQFFITFLTNIFPTPQVFGRLCPGFPSSCKNVLKARPCPVHPSDGQSGQSQSGRNRTSRITLKKSRPRCSADYSDYYGIIFNSQTFEVESFNSASLLPSLHHWCNNFLRCTSGKVILYNCY